MAKELNTANGVTVKMTPFVVVDEGTTMADGSATSGATINLEMYTTDPTAKHFDECSTLLTLEEAETLLHNLSETIEKLRNFKQED